MFKVVTGKKETVNDVFRTMMKLGNHVPTTRSNSLATIDNIHFEVISNDHMEKSDHTALNRNEIDNQKGLIENILDGQVMLHPAFMMEYEGKSCIFRDDDCFVCIFHSRITQRLVAVKFVYKSRLTPLDYLITSGHRKTLKDLKRYIDGDVSLPRYLVHYETSEFYVIVTETIGLSKTKETLETMTERIAAKFGVDVRWSFEWREHFKRAT